MVRCIQGIILEDAISLEFVRMVHIANVRCIMDSLYPGFNVKYCHVLSYFYVLDRALTPIYPYINTNTSFFKIK